MILGVGALSSYAMIHPVVSSAYLNAQTSGSFSPGSPLVGAFFWA